MTLLPYDKRLKPNSRSLRSNMTDAEQHLWQYLRRKQINGWQFYRQKPLGAYIVDFYCAVAHLVVELDGSQHFENAHQRADQQRDTFLQSLGLRVLRFDNRQVLLETDAVLEVIRQIPPAPLFQRGESVVLRLWHQLIPAVPVLPTLMKTKPYQTPQTQSPPLKNRQH